MTFWCVRAGENGEQEEDAYANRVITIGWSELPDLIGKNADELESLYKKVYPDSDISASNIGQIVRFIEEIQKGDLVALPRKFLSEYAYTIGEVLSDYEYHQYSENVKHTRHVRWLKTIAKSSLPTFLQNSLNSSLTVFRVERNDAEKVIRNIIGDDKVMNIPENEPVEDDEDVIMKKQRELLEGEEKVSRDPTLFKPVNYTLLKLVQDIDMHEIALPYIQRPFVWSAVRVRDLFDSMYKGYPVGHLMFWSNPQTKEVKRIGEKDGIGTPRLLIIDGQQRLTSLYAVMKNVAVIDDDYNPYHIVIAFKPRDGTFAVSTPIIQKDPEYIANISDMWATKTAPYQFVKTFIEKLRKYHGSLSETEETVISKSIDRLYGLQHYPFTALELSSKVDEEDASYVFVRINSQGVPLKQSDFILTLMSVFWEEGRRQLETFCKNARQPSTSIASPFNHFIKPDPDELLRVAVALGFKRARLRYVYSILRGKDLETEEYSDELREEQFSILRMAQSHVLDLSNWHEFLKTLLAAGFRSERMIASKMALLYSYAMYLIGQEDFKVEHNQLRDIISRWFFVVSLSSRYTTSTETRMESDLSVLRDVKDSAGFVEALERIISNTLTRDYWEIKLPNELAKSAARSPSLFAYDAALNILGADALFSRIKVSELLDPSTKSTKSNIERHHLFPKKYLEEVGITDNKEVNQIANQAWLEWPDNIEISGEAPSLYFPRYLNRVTPEMRHLHVLPEGWEKVSYHDFLAVRRKGIAGIIHKAYEHLSKPYSQNMLQENQSTESMILAGESNVLEFKSSMMWDAQGTENNNMTASQLMIMKTIAAFMNSEGGTLLVGVDDNGKVVGIERDYEVFHDKKNWDTWSQHLVNLIRKYIGTEFAMYVSAVPVKLDGRTVAKITARKCMADVYVEYRDDKGQERVEYYIRALNTTQSLNQKQADEYKRRRRSS